MNLWPSKYDKKLKISKSTYLITNLKSNNKRYNEMIKKLLLMKKMVPQQMFKNRKTRFDVNLMARSSTTGKQIH